MERVVDIDLMSPLNMSFVNKKDKQGKFIKNSGVISEAGLHNAFMQSGEGQWLGEFNEAEIRETVPITRVLEFNNDFEVGNGKLIWLTPEIHAVFPGFTENVIKLSDGRTVEFPDGTRHLDWKASSGAGNQYLVAVRWDAARRFYVHIFHINNAGNPIFRQVNIAVPNPNPNISSQPVNQFRMATGELGSLSLVNYMNSVNRIECYPVVVGSVLHVGFDVGSFSLNSCAVINLQPNGDIPNTGALQRVVKGFYIPDLRGNVWGYPIPENFYTPERGYSPFLRGANDEFLSLDTSDPLAPPSGNNQTVVNAQIHRGVVYNNLMLHHLPTGTTRDPTDLNNTQSRTNLVAAWNANVNGQIRLPLRTSQNLRSRFFHDQSTFPQSFALGVTAMFSGFAGVREPLEVTSNGTRSMVLNFGGFYCVPTRKHPVTSLSNYGIAQHSMVGIMEIRHEGLANPDWESPEHIITGTNPNLTNIQQGDVVRAALQGDDNIPWVIQVGHGIIQFIRTWGNFQEFRCIGIGEVRLTNTIGNQTIIFQVRPAVGTGEEIRLQIDLGRAVLNYPAKQSVSLTQSSYGVFDYTPVDPEQGTFTLTSERLTRPSNANIFYSGDMQIPLRANVSQLSQEVLQAPSALGIFDAHVFGIPGIDVFITTASGEALWTSINDTKVSTGAPSQIITSANDVLLVFDQYTVYAHRTNRDNSMIPEIRIITNATALISQTGINMLEKENGRITPQHAFSGLGYITNIIGRVHPPHTDEVQSNFQDILQNNTHGNVLPPNAFTLPQGFSAATPQYYQPVQHININTPPVHIRENINAFRYAFPISVKRGPNLDQWVMVRGNHETALIIDGILTLTSDILAGRSRLRHLVILGQRFAFNEMLITPVNFEMGQRVYGESINKLNKDYAGSSTRQAYFFDRVSKTIDTFSLDSGFDAGTPLDLIDAVMQATPMGEFSYTNVRRLCEKKGVEEVLLQMSPNGVFFRDFGSFKIDDDVMLAGDSGLLVQRSDKWELLRNTVLYEHMEKMAAKEDDSFSHLQFAFQTGFIGEDGSFIVPRFWEIDFYLSNAVRVLYKGNENKEIKVKIGSESIHDRRKWNQPMREFSMRVKDFKDGYYTIRLDCLAEECSSQSLIFSTDDYVHISSIAFKYVSRLGGTSR